MTNDKPATATPPGTIDKTTMNCVSAILQEVLAVGRRRAGTWIVEARTVST